MLAGPPVTGADDWHGILAGVFGAMAMGTQSVVVRLLMRGIPQTNVMTGNMTQLGIETTELFSGLAAPCARARATPTARANSSRCAARLFIVLAIAIGFILGAAVRRSGLCQRRPARHPARRRAGRRADLVGDPARADDVTPAVTLRSPSAINGALCRPRPASTSRPAHRVAQTLAARLCRRASFGRNGARLCSLLRWTSCLSMRMKALRSPGLSGARISRCVDATAARCRAASRRPGGVM